MHPVPQAQTVPNQTDTTLSDVLKKLPRIRSRWPFEAALAKKTMFNLYDGDRVVGIVSLNTGANVKILDIRHEHVVVIINGNQSPVPVINTDIIDRMGGPAKILSFPDDPKPEPTETSKPTSEKPKGK